MKATQRYTSVYDRTYFVAELDGNYAFFVDDEPFLTIHFEKPPESIEQVLAIFVDVADQYSDPDNLKLLLQRDYGKDY